MQSTETEVQCVDSTETKLESHPINNNQDLLEFNVRSRDILWKEYVRLLIERGTPRRLTHKFNDLSNCGTLVEDERPEVLVCHDMMGNYRDDRFYGSRTKWDDYRFYHWSGIDYFCYFSHNYITIPPPGWINAAHLNGVRVLGTFITENVEGEKLLKEVLESEETASQIADALVKLCQHFGFEGFLINVECQIQPKKIPILRHFVRVLTKKIHETIPFGFIIWYDSVIEDGSLMWQNCVNSLNGKWLCECDGILINYNWHDSHLFNTSNYVQEMKEKLTKVFMGIDVFGRGQVARMDSYKTLSRITPYNMSVGIFAPGWTFESFCNHIDINSTQPNDHLNKVFLDRNDEYWCLMWTYLITHSVKTLPFYTEFCIGSGKYTFESGQKTNKPFFNFSQQSLLPTIPLKYHCEYYFEDAVGKGSCLKIIKSNENLRLFTTDFHVEKTLIFAYASKVLNSADEIDCILKISSAGKKCYIICGKHDHKDSKVGEIFLQPIDEKNFNEIKKALKYDKMKLPFTLSNNWDVRYFSVQFDSGIHVEDIGVCLKTASKTISDGFLGALFLEVTTNEFENSTKILCKDFLM